MADQSKKSYWLDNPKNINLIVWGLVILCIALFFIDGFYKKHPHFDVEQLFGFYGVYGFFVCVALVLVAKALRKVLMRSEDYYDSQDDTSDNANTPRYDHE